MATNERFDEAVSKWLEEEAPARLPERVLGATFERTRHTRQHVGWRALLGRLSMPRFVPALGSTVAVVVAGALALNFFANQQGGPGSSASATPIVAASPSPVDLGIFEPVAGRIVYYSGGPSLWAVDPNAPAGSATRVELTSEAGTPLGWSSDGTRLLIMRGSGGEQQLFVLHADGSETQVTGRPITMIRSATISPDGSRVVFVGSTDTPGGECCGPWALYAVDADGGPAEVLGESRIGILDEVSFSPDGTRIAYADGAGDHSHSVWLMDADGSDAHQIVSNEWTAAAGHVGGLAWSPAGDRLALAIEGTIYTFAPDGSEFALVISGHRPHWSPDGSQFAYTISCLSNPNGCGLGVADADGSNVRTFRFGGASGPWHPGTRSPSVESTSPPSPTVERTAVPSIPSSMWPQSTLEEVRQAQELADAGDSAYRWQVDRDLGARLSQGGPYRAAIFARFLEEELGWEEFRSRNGGGPMFIRCAPDLKNPFYPDDPNGSCAPTIDEFRYETVQINVAQPIRQDDTGIWVVTEWEMGEPYEQLAPLSEAQTATLLNGFLQARIDGEGAEEYVRVLVDGPEIPFLYATPTGAPYERYEFEVANGPMWPDGQMRLRVRLFAEDGDTVVEQLLLLERLEQGLWYESYSHWVEPGPGTTVNGEAVPVPHSLLDGEVTLRLTHPWYGANWEIGSGFHMYTDEFGGTMTFLPLSSQRLTTGCQNRPAPADAQSLAETIRSNPDLVATAPVTMSIGGMPALQLYVTSAPGVSDCEPSDGPGLVTSPVVMEVPVYSEIELRLYLVDLPQGSSARILAIAFEGTFDVVESAAPILESIEFHAP